MTPDRLRQMADAATPGPWNADGWAVLSEELWDAAGPSQLALTACESDAALIAVLGPDAARLLADAMEYVERCVGTDESTWVERDLLARFVALGEETP